MSENENSEEGNAELAVNSKGANPERADDILTAPNGSYIGTFTLGEEEGSLGNVTALKLELLDNENNVLATNTLKDETSASIENKSTITTGFNIGQTTRYGVSDWNHSPYTNKETFPSKILATYTINGTTYQVTKNINVSAPDDMYSAEEHSVAQYIVDNYGYGNVDSIEDIDLSNTVHSEFNVSDVSPVAATNFVDVTINNNSDQIIGTVRLRQAE